MVTTDRIYDVIQSGWLANNQASIELANNGVFEWGANDTVLISYPVSAGTSGVLSSNISSYSSQLFSVSKDMSSVVPIPSLFPANYGVQPYTGGGQANAAQLIFGVNKILTVVAPGNSVRLPEDVQGAICVVQNLGVNPVNVFPFPGSSINQLGANVAISLPAGVAAQFIGMSLFNWSAWLN
jgi:hypothetical protein